MLIKGPISSGGISSRIILRTYSTLPPRKSYTANSNLVKYLWYRKIPTNFKYFSAIGIAAWGIIHIHPNVLITVLPPVVTGGYFAYKRWMKYQWNNQTSKLLPRTENDLTKTYNRIKINKYDETSIKNIELGIESQYDSLKKQILDLVDTRVVDFISRSNRNDNALQSKLVDNNNQIMLNIDKGNIETFISTKVQFNKLLVEGVDTDDGVDLSQEVDFITFSVPLLSGKFSDRNRRIGTIQISLLEVPQKEETYFEEYIIRIELTPFRLIESKRQKILVEDTTRDSVQKSSVLNTFEKSKV